MTRELVAEQVAKLKGAAMIVYPMGLPPYDEVQRILDGTEQLDGRHASLLPIEPEEAQLWFAGKVCRPPTFIGGARLPHSPLRCVQEIVRGKKLADVIGANEKTKLVVKLQKRGGGAPVREPVVDEQLQKEVGVAWPHGQRRSGLTPGWRGR